MWRRKIKSYKNVLTHRTKSDIIKASRKGNELSGDRNKQRTAREVGEQTEKQRIKLKRKGEKQNGKKLDGV